MRSALIDQQVHDNHKDFSSIEEATVVLRRLFGRAKLEGTWERDKTMQVFSCPLYRTLGLHWHVGHKRTEG